MALDYQKIWEQINTQIKQGVISIGGEETTESVLNRYIEELDKVQRVENDEEGYKDGSSIWDFVKI